MRLFHGTNADFDKIDITKSNPWKDFGKGFYLTDIYEQAQRWAGERLLSLEDALSYKNTSSTKSICTKVCLRSYHLTSLTRNGPNSFS